MKRILFGFSVAYIVVSFISLEIAYPVQRHETERANFFPPPHPKGDLENKHKRVETQANPKPVRYQPLQNDEKTAKLLSRIQKGKEIQRPEGSNNSKSITADTVTVAGLDCSRYGGPDDPSEMVYWRDIPRDAEYVSPHISKQDKYVTFEPDEGGFNNIRMALETVIALAVAMGRTLVLPPAQGMYLLDDVKNSSQKSRFSFTDFYPLEAVARENKALKLMSMEEFLQRQDLLINRTTREQLQPPSGRTDWNGASRAEIMELHKWLRWVGVTPSWHTSKCLVLLVDPPANRIVQLSGWVTRMMMTKERGRLQILDHGAAPVNATFKVRLAQFVQHRTEVCPYDSEYQAQKVIHFTGDIASRTRMLVHFYAFLFFGNWTTDLWMKRFVRDHLRYVDEIQCAAARIVKELRMLSITNDFDTFHIRRGDFKVNKVLLNADEIYATVEDVMTTNSTIYIATDEQNRSFFEPFYRRHKVYFLDDFHHLIRDLNTNVYGLVEQLVLARGHQFVGCMFSTFTGFVNRLRGYHSTRDKLPGYESGALPTSYHYAPKRSKTAMHKYQFFSKPLTAREFPIAWRDIDFDAGNQRSFPSNSVSGYD